MAMRHALSAIALAFLGAASQAAPGAPTLDELIGAKPNGAQVNGIPELRYTALIETARTRGNSAGLAWEAKNIAARLEANGGNLDIIYNFGALMLEGNVLPPVLSKALDVYDQQDDKMIRLVGESYSIQQPARFTYVAPSWRSYLVFSDYQFDASAAPMVAPENDKEREVWRKATEEGYAMGVEQARQILDLSFRRLKADFEGMQLYRELLRKNMVTKPYVASGHYGVTGDKDKVLNVGETILTISATPEFVLDREQWKAQPKGQTAELLKAADRAAQPEPAKDAKSGKGAAQK